MGRPKFIRPKKYPKPPKEGSETITVKPAKPAPVVEDEIESTDNVKLSASAKRRKRKSAVIQKLKKEGKLVPKVKKNKTKPSLPRQRKEVKVEKANIMAKKIEKATKSSAKVAGGSPPKSAGKKKSPEKLLKKEAVVEKMEVEIAKPKGKKKKSVQKSTK